MNSRKFVPASNSVSMQSVVLWSYRGVVQISPRVEEEPQRCCRAPEAASGFLDELVPSQDGETRVSFTFKFPEVEPDHAIRSFGLSHDLSKRLGASYDIPHGVSSVCTESLSSSRHSDAPSSALPWHPLLLYKLK